MQSHQRFTGGLTLAILFHIDTFVSESGHIGRGRPSGQFVSLSVHSRARQNVIWRFLSFTVPGRQYGRTR